MVAALAPIDAGATEWALVALEERHVNATFQEETLTGNSQGSRSTTTRARTSRPIRE
jgi:hypothetical protein